MTEERIEMGEPHVKKRRRFVAATVMVLLSGGMVGPDYRRPTVTAPDVFRGSPAATAPDAQSIAELKWFEVFKDEQLQQLIRTALAQNYDLRDAVARVDAARAVPIEGSIALFLAGTALHLFATTSIGVFLATVARSMPRFGMLLMLMLVLLPLQMLSGGTTPRESMPEFVQVVMLAAATTHFVMLAQAILYRGAGLSVVWPQFVALAVIGAALSAPSLTRFWETIGAMA